MAYFCMPAKYVFIEWKKKCSRESGNYVVYVICWRVVCNAFMRNYTWRNNKSEWENNTQKKSLKVFPH
jgi:hypothetical protein